MLPGGMMPVVQLIAIIRSSPAREAARLLKDMPAERLPVVTAAMGPADITRLLPAASPDFRSALMGALAVEQLIELLRPQSTDQAIALLSTLSEERLNVVAESLPAELVAALLARMPASRQAELLEAMDPGKAFAALSRRYEHEIADSLVRANVEVTVPNGAPSGIVLAQGLGWRIVVAARYGDDGRIAVRDAEDGAFRLGATGALSVTSLKPADDVVGYCRESRLQGRVVDALRWTDTRHDGYLKRALVSLFH